jgi:hypothetical protein
LPLGPAPWQITSYLGATPGGYTGKPGRAKRPYFTGLSRSHFKVAEREGFASPLRASSALRTNTSAPATTWVDLAGFRGSKHWSLQWREVARCHMRAARLRHPASIFRATQTVKTPSKHRNCAGSLLILFGPLSKSCLQSLVPRSFVAPPGLNGSQAAPLRLPFRSQQNLGETPDRSVR